MKTNHYVLIFLGLLILLLFSLTSFHIHQFSRKTYHPPKADYAIILGAKTEGHGPSPLFSERIDHGIRLYKLGRVSKLIFTGKPGQPSQAMVGKLIALTKGVPAGDALVEDRSRNTWENLLYSKFLIQDKKEPQFLIVSQSLHLKRALEMSQDLKMKAHPAPIPNSILRSKWENLKFLFRETLAYAWYRIKRNFH